LIKLVAKFDNNNKTTKTLTSFTDNGIMRVFQTFRKNKPFFIDACTPFGISIFFNCNSIDSFLQARYAEELWLIQKQRKKTSLQVVFLSPFLPLFQGFLV